MNDSTCTEPGCDRPLRCKGYCNMHYSRLRATGQTASQHRATAQKLAWIDELIDEAGEGCRDWPWSVRRGYGRLSIEGTEWSACHLVLERSGRPRPAPPEHYALHSCDRPVCVAPWHLRWGTAAENSREMVARGRFSNGR